MQFKEFAEKSIELIHEPRKEDEYLDEINRLFKRYGELCQQIDEPIEAKKAFSSRGKMSLGQPWKWVCTTLRALILDFYSGRTLDAANTLHHSFFNKNSVFDGHISSVYMTIPKDAILFRARVKNEGVPFKKDDLLHIPFSKRHMVQNLRYSISGLPSFYFGSDSYTCWEELNRPEFSKVAFSGFKLKKAISVLDLRIPTLQESYTAVEKLSFVIRMPFLLTVTRKVKIKDAPFKPEYVISQMLAQVAQEHTYNSQRSFMGIAFSSSKIDYLSNTSNGFYNVYIPNIYHRDIEYSPTVEEYFEVSKPVEWEVTQALSEGKFSGSSASSFPKCKDLSVDGNNKIDYNLTRWGLIGKEIKSKF